MPRVSEIHYSAVGIAYPLYLRADDADLYLRTTLWSVIDEYLQYATPYFDQSKIKGKYDYRKLADDLAERKSRGAYKNTEFIADTIHELK